MRKEFVSRKYGQILLRRLENVKQDSRSVQAYYDKLYSSLHRANVLDDINAMEYFERGLNDDTATALEGKYFRSLQDLLSYAIREEKKIMKMQQDKITRPINLSQDFCAKLHSDISSVVGEKSSSTPYKKREHAVPKFSYVDSSAKRREHKQCNSKKSFVEQQEDSFMPQVDERNDKQDQEESSAAHATEELKEYAVVSPHGNLKITQQEAPSQCLNPTVVELTSLVPCSSDKCGEVVYSKPVQNFSLRHGESSEAKCDQEIDSTSDFEGASNLNLKADQSVNLRAECEKKIFLLCNLVQVRNLSKMNFIMLQKICSYKLVLFQS